MIVARFSVMKIGFLATTRFTTFEHAFMDNDFGDGTALLSSGRRE